MNFKRLPGYFGLLFVGLLAGIVLTGIMNLENTDPTVANMVGMVIAFAFFGSIVWVYVWALYLAQKSAKGVILKVAVLTTILLATTAFIYFIPYQPYRRGKLRSMAGLSLYRQVDAAKDQYALATNKREGSTITPAWADLTPWLKADSKLALSGGKDNFGNPIIIGSLSERLRVHPRTKKILEEVTGGDLYWGPYS